MNETGETAKIEKYKKYKKKYTDNMFCKNVSQLCKTKLLDQLFISKIDNARNTINYTNGIYELNTGIFRERTRDDYISQYLPFAYTTDIDQKIIDEVKTVFFQISNSDNKLMEFNLCWLGYCLTGETEQQKFLFVVGHTAQNGKSTLAKMFSSSLPIYSCKMDKKTFTKGYTKAHKQFAQVRKPVRFVYIEELDRIKLDVDLLKDFVDGDKICNEVMYGTTEDIKIHCKLLCTSNNDPVFDTDEGIKRRGILEVLTNKFLDKAVYDKIPNKKGIYIKDITLIKKFDTNDAYKMAFIYLLLPYAKKYYDNGLIIDSTINNSFGDLCNENDDIDNFIETFYVITNDCNDRIHKDEFLLNWNTHFKTKIAWAFLISDVKRKLKYDKDKRMDGRKGVILGLKHKPINDVEENGI
jgi:phage/plasmid-associated DNA primase